MSKLPANYIYRLREVDSAYGGGKLQSLQAQFDKISCKK